MKSNGIQTLDHHPRVSIGLPVYNGEKFIRKKLDSLLTQSFKDFEIIISDNASTDSTSHICEEYSKKDQRIRYIRQEKNMGAVWNYNFVLKNAKYSYFLWTAADDILLPEFIEKNMKILLSQKNVVCSISRMKLYGNMTDYLNPYSKDTLFTKIMKKIQRELGYMDNYPASGTYEQRIIEFFKNLRHNQIFYGIYRTEQVRKCFVSKSFIGLETATILNILRYGDLYVTDEVLMHVYDGGMSRSGMISTSKQINKGIFGIIFPLSSFTFWCAKNLETRLFLKNLVFFIKINSIAAFSLSVDLIRLFKTKISNF